MKVDKTRNEAAEDSSGTNVVSQHSNKIDNNNNNMVSFPSPCPDNYFNEKGEREFFKSFK